MRYLLALTLALTASLSHAGESPLVVHEWGTFTSWQNPQGDAIGGGNLTAEPLPKFVYDQLPVVAGKAGTALWPGITMRLETPVIYFYPSVPKLTGVRVEVAFPHGWLTEYYPQGTAKNPGLEQQKMADDCVSTLVWDQLELSGKEPGPETTSGIWLAPREVDATSVTTPSGQRERYLFYRGVAHLESPVRTIRKDNEIRFELNANLSGQLRHHYVLASIGKDGACAFRSIPAASADPKLPLAFSETDYSVDNRAALRELLRKQLVDDGLFPKEAEAMLNTWENDYLRQEGLRVFFVTPKAWTDAVLPLTISPAAEVTRVMIGRIELR